MSLEQVAYEIMVALAPVLAAALTALIGIGVAYFRHKYTWARHLKAVDEMESTLKALVAEANQTFVEAAKAANSDGKLTSPEADAIKRKVIERFTNQLTKGQRAVLGAVTADVSGWVESRLERYVVDMKRTDVQKTVDRLADPPSPASS